MGFEAIGDGNGSPLADSLIELVEHFDGDFPVDTGVSDADTVLEVGGATFGHVLTASVDVGFNHHTGDVLRLG